MVSGQPFPKWTLLANGISGTIWPDSPKSDLTKGVNSKETGNEGELSTCFAIRQQSQNVKQLSQLQSQDILVLSRLL
jgi:hypothetical protein